MRYLALGDIHGCFHALETLAAFVPFSPRDLVITLGDYVDRGPDTYAVLEWLIDYKRRGNLVALRGNHELMMLEARNSKRDFEIWLLCGGDAALASYSRALEPDEIPRSLESHWSFLERETRRWFETEEHFFVHAGAFGNCALEAQPDSVLYWERFDDPAPHESGKIMVCGHTPQKNGTPRNIGHAVCIDTWAYGGGWLTCLDVNSGRYWQANQHRETKTGCLNRAGQAQQ